MADAAGVEKSAQNHQRHADPRDEAAPGTTKGLPALAPPPAAAAAPKTSSTANLNLQNTMPLGSVVPPVVAAPPPETVVGQELDSGGQTDTATADVKPKPRKQRTKKTTEE